ncbi:MAG: tRNA (N6-threonylcarbamoyladenosine(37)-N6)-methyltransferase TrmO [Phycisphaeraceae bacterium]|nr:tRNA (N6-threonylcarbamoyladenosine(37)-N6)-methyltransferase TrmO [Phycisphaeraceae bacterium]
MRPVNQAFEYYPIGIIHAPHAVPQETPIQPVFAETCVGWAEIQPEYAEGLQDLEGFSHVHLLYHLHRAGPAIMTVKPFMDTRPRGLFATRHSCRPNPIGLSLVELLAVEGCILRLKGVDMLDQTPLLDIKPFVPRFDELQDARGGWTELVSDKQARQRGAREFKKGNP